MNYTCCLYCKNREIGCHKSCKEYQEYRKRLDDVKAVKKAMSIFNRPTRCYKH